MSGIFISYRREDARGDAGRLADYLKERLGKNQIFRDIDTIEPGLDFVKAINKAVTSCDVLLALIGSRWLTATDNKGMPRLNDANDYLRLEIAAALNRDIRVIPVLVGGASMPSAEELPDVLKELARRQAYDLSDKHWDYDVAELIDVIEKVPGIKLGSTSFRSKEQSTDSYQSSASFEALAKVTRLFGGSSKKSERSFVDEQSAPKPGMSISKKILWGILTLVILGGIGECNQSNTVPYYTYPTYYPY